MRMQNNLVAGWPELVSAWIGRRPAVVITVLAAFCWLCIAAMVAGVWH